MKYIAWTLAIGAFLGSSAASAAHVDFLDQGDFNLTLNNSGTVSTTVTGIPTGSTLGGQRFVELSLDSDATASATLDSNALSYNTGAAGSLLVDINAGANQLNANFLDIPMSNLNWNRLRLDFGAQSSAGASVTVQLISDGLGTVALTQPFGGGGVLDFFYADFGSLTPAFLRDVDAASFLIDTDTAGSFTVNSFIRAGAVPQAVPGPGSLGLMMLGLLGLFGVITLRRKV